jgi:hypothetical protein
MLAPPPPAPAARLPRGPALATWSLPLRGTLLASAAALGKACFVSDAPLYFQRALQPATDVFTPASRLVRPPAAGRRALAGRQGARPTAGSGPKALLVGRPPAGPPGHSKRQALLATPAS